MVNRKHTPDLFSLQEDDVARRRAHVLQYTLISVFAVLLLSAALYMSFWLTQDRLKYEQSIVKEPPIGDPGPTTALEPVDANYWPGTLFPDLPKIEASVYDTRIDPLHPAKAEVDVPMAAAARFADYANTLADDGASIFVKTQRMIVVAYKGMELHLLYGSTRNAAVICAEPEISFTDPSYSAFPMPQAGKLVDVSEVTGEGGRVLTYRLASSADVLGYCAELITSGWTVSGTLEPVDQIFATSFKKEGAEGQPGMQISVDYFSGSDNYRIRFGFIQSPTPAAPIA